ncbi:hypothetical protein [Haloferax sp. DFSO60]|uniref:hypothetical protein n=1 Tax=Haloferax sp. DFSO60 TaxID=3388652 RepID=UPI0039787788
MDVDVIDALQQSEYTGENRCEPCTALNLIIAVILGSAIARKSKLGGALAVGVSVGIIYLRGYLVPGTPVVTKQYLPPTVLRWFGKIPSGGNTANGLGARGTPKNQTTDTVSAKEVTETPETSIPTTDSSTSGGDSDEHTQTAANDGLEKLLIKWDVLEPCTDKNDLCLTNSFETAWVKESEPLADSEITTDMVIDIFGIDHSPSNLELISENETKVLYSEIAVLGQWPSHTALVADLAACRILKSQVPDWREFDADERGSVLNRLRAFLETCPTTGGDVQLSEEVVESCCSSHRVIAIRCEETGDRLFEYKQPAE